MAVEEVAGLWRVGVDIGGTFTDLVAEHPDGRRRLAKVLTTPGQEILGVLAALEAGRLDEGVSQLVHGTTLVINSLIQRLGARTAFVTTKGFRDVLELARGSRPEPFNLFYERAPVLVPRDLRFEIDERTIGDGAVTTVPNDSQIEQLAEELRSAGVEAVAVGFLNSYLNPANEELVAGRLREILDGVEVTASSQLSRQWREYERFATACANAYVAPSISDYIEQLLDRVRGRVREGGVLFLDARGGALRPQTAREIPLRLVESGPIGGIVASVGLGARLGLTNLVTLDIGGTTAKSALIEDGRVGVLDEYWVGGYTHGFPVQVPVVDIVEVGAGGGSLGWMTDDGRLQVGPRSAGASPGPACYGAGGREPTVTDAHAVCGRLGPEFFLSVIELRPELAVEACTSLAERCGMSVDRLALGMLELANLTMASAVSKQTVERGRDPRQFTLVACGGAGPLHACEIASTIGIERVLVPAAPGHYSASGMLDATLSFSIRGVLNASLTELDSATMTAALDGLTADLHRHSGLRQDESDAEYRCRFSMRYAGQEHTLDIAGIPARDTRREGWTGEELRPEFVRAYRDRFGYGDSDAAIEVVELELEVSLPATSTAGPTDRAPDEPDDDGAGAERSTVSCLVSEAVGRVDVPVVPRSLLGANEELVGPAIVYEIGSVTFVPPGWVVERLGEFLSLEPVGASA